MTQLFPEDPDTVVIAMPTHTVIGIPPPTHLPASPPPAPGAGYLHKYPVQLDHPLEVVIHWGNGIDWGAR